MSTSRRSAVALAGLLLIAATARSSVAEMPPGVVGEPSSAPASTVRVDLAGSDIVDLGANLRIVLSLGRPVPWRIYTLEAPRRLIIEFSEVDWSGQAIDGLDQSDIVTGVAAGPAGAGWSRLVLTLGEPMQLETAGLGVSSASGRAVLKVQLAPSDAERFARDAGAPPGVNFEATTPASLVEPRRRQGGEAEIVVVLDPGHGGFDPGAEAGDVTEARLMLTFAHELRRVLEQTGRMRVVLTREDDVFVPLETRATRARAAAADVLLSLHADALPEGRASGATIYTLSPEAGEAAAPRLLAERHDRRDLLGGVDLTGQGDEIVAVLMDMARPNTAPRSERLALRLVEGLAEHTGDLYKRPRLRADVSVLRAPDIPAALIELGFVSSARDRARLTDPAWRARAAAGIRDALLAWAREDAAEARLLGR